MHPESVVSHVLGMAGDGARCERDQSLNRIAETNGSDWINGKVPGAGAAASQVASAGQAHRSS